MSTENKKVLIVDDEPDTVAFLSNWLEDNGYSFCTASDGEQGLRVITQESPDLVLMDLRMPRHTGFQLYRELRSNELLKEDTGVFCYRYDSVPDFRGWMRSPSRTRGLH